MAQIIRARSTGLQAIDPQPQTATAGAASRTSDRARGISRRRANSHHLACCVHLIIKALVRAHRWRRRMESGRARSITDLAEQENVAVAYVCRLLPLTCLAPYIVEAILDGGSPRGLRLAETLGNGPIVWEEQRRGRATN